MLLHIALNRVTGTWILPSFHAEQEQVDVLVAQQNYGMEEPVWIHETINMMHPGFTQFRNAMNIHIEGALLRVNGDEPQAVIAQTFTGRLASDQAIAEREAQVKKDHVLQKHLQDSATMSGGPEVRAIGPTPAEQAKINSAFQEAAKAALQESKEEKASLHDVGSQVTYNNYSNANSAANSVNNQVGQIAQAVQVENKSMKDQLAAIKNKIATKQEGSNVQESSTTDSKNDVGTSVSTSGDTSEVDSKQSIPD